jgi:2-polyprenyl-3-methyl-5-hydroxy-6-metoxy-1,4-benzoquinol methylase
MSIVKTIASALTFRPLAHRFIRIARKGQQQPGAKGAEWYDSAYEHTLEYRQHYSKSSYYFLWAVVADRIARSGVRQILDIGCGPGQFASLLHDKGIRSYRGLDFSSKCITMAKHRCPFFEFAIADLSHTAILRDLPYDAIVSLEFLEHVPFDLEVVGGIRRGTKVFATVPNFPYVSHVRHFTSEADVRLRYERFFSDLSVDAFLENPEGKTFYLMDGIKV